jgi:NAD+ diphosphatase
MSFIPTVQEPETPTHPALWLIFRGNDLLVHADAQHSPELPIGIGFPFPALSVIRRQFLGYWGEQPCFSAEAEPVAPPPSDFEWVGLRSVFGRLPDELFWLAARAVQIMDWDRTHQYCSRCGQPVKARSNERSKECAACGYLAFPRIAPAVIIRITRGREILLARSRHFAPGMFSVIAGFVEPGENLEQAAMREIKEEVGLEVCHLRYFASQPWPFPHSLMIAFTAEHAGGEIQVDQHELEEAHWFSLDHLPNLPGPLSISRRLIDDFIFHVATTSN